MSLSPRGRRIAERSGDRPDRTGIREPGAHPRYIRRNKAPADSSIHVTGALKRGSMRVMVLRSVMRQ
jgi:hypothetical protein